MKIIKFSGDRTIQMYGTSEGFPLQCIKFGLGSYDDHYFAIWSYKKNRTQKKPSGCLPEHFRVTLSMDTLFGGNVTRPTKKSATGLYKPVENVLSFKLWDIFFVCFFLWIFLKDAFFPSKTRQISDFWGDVGEFQRQKKVVDVPAGFHRILVRYLFTGIIKSPFFFGDQTSCKSMVNLREFPFKEVYCLGGWPIMIPILRFRATKPQGFSFNQPLF